MLQKKFIFLKMTCYVAKVWKTQLVSISQRYTFVLDEGINLMLTIYLDVVYFKDFVGILK